MKNIVVFIVLFVSGGVNAAWLNSTGTVKDIITYSSRETVLVNLSISGAVVDECSNETTFAISKELSPEARARMYSMLLSAQATGRTVVVSYEDSGGCESWGSSPNVYRKIVRLR